MTVCIFRRTDDPAAFRVVPGRCVVARRLAWTSRHRRCMRDFETLPEHAEAMIHIETIMSLSRRLARYPIARRAPTPPDRR